MFERLRAPTYTAQLSPENEKEKSRRDELLLSSEERSRLVGHRQGREGEEQKTSEGDHDRQEEDACFAE